MLLSALDNQDSLIFFNDLAVAHPGDGFRFLRLVVTRVHPGWHEQPGVALRSPPKQDDEKTLLHYHMLFVDYLLMSGYIFGNKESFDQTEVQDKFIGGARWRCVLSVEDPSRDGHFQY